MTTATARSTINGLTVTVSVEASAIDLSDDAERGAHAVAEALTTLRFTRDMQALREEYRAASEGEIDADCTDTEYGRLISYLEPIADNAATAGWHNPEGAFVTVDVEG